MSLFLHDIDDTDVRRGDTLRDPKHLVAEGSKALKTFDRVMANPPFSLKKWGHENWKDGDVFGRDKYGCPPKSYGDLAFVQHMLASVKNTGMVGVVVPHGVLFRGGAEGKIRAGMLQDDLIEAVLGLGSNLFYGAGIPAAIIIFNRAKPEFRRGKVLLVNGSEEMIPGTNQNTLSPENVERFIQAFAAFKDEERFCRVVSTTEIKKADFNLNLTRYVSLQAEDEPVDVATELKALQCLRSQRDEAESRMLKLVGSLGYGD